jgi:hypothetical protein
MLSLKMVNFEIIMNQTTGKIIMIIGLIIILIGLLVYFFGNKLNFLGRLPGDIRVERENFSFYFPITTCILVSLFITGIVKIVQWFLK